MSEGIKRPFITADMWKCAQVEPITMMAQFHLGVPVRPARQHAAQELTDTPQWIAAIINVINYTCTRCNSSHTLEQTNFPFINIVLKKYTLQYVSFIPSQTCGNKYYTPIGC